MKCDVCGSEMQKGSYGQAKYICENKGCEKSNPNWVQQYWIEKFAPINQQIEQYMHFSMGTIILDEQGDLDHGSALLQLNGGQTIHCHIHHGKLEPLEDKEKAVTYNIDEQTIEEIKTNIKKIFELRTEMEKLMLQNNS